MVFASTLLSMVAVAQSPAGTETRLDLNSTEVSDFNKRLTGQWSAAISARGFDEGVDDAFGSALRFRTFLNYRLFSELKFQSNIDLRLFAGRIEARFDDISQNFLKAREFSLVYQPTSWLTLQGGAHNQEFLRSDLLLDDYGFPGAKEALHFNFAKNWRLNLIAQQAIPTSASLRSERSEKEPLPTFFTETVELNYKSGDDLDATIYGTLYDFNDLPSVVAYESQKYGNSVLGGFSPNSRFAYDFKGYLAGFVGKYQAHRLFSVEGGGQWINNLAAEDDGSRGQRLFALAHLQAGNTIFSPLVETFFNESNTSPGYYNEGDKGHNNRKGYSTGLEITFKNLGFRVWGKYIVADVIDKRIYQDRLTNYVLQVETLYVEF